MPSIGGQWVDQKKREHRFERALSCSGLCGNRSSSGGVKEWRND